MPSSVGTNQVGPTVSRLDSPICRPIATRTVSCTGQNAPGPVAVGRDGPAGSATARPRTERVGGAPEVATLNGMGIENPVHLLFIAAVALIVLGPKQLPEMAKALGHGIREFREAINQPAAAHIPPSRTSRRQHGPPGQQAPGSVIAQRSPCRSV